MEFIIGVIMFTILAFIAVTCLFTWPIPTILGGMAIAALVASK